ncbi:CreA family protein [Neisseria chenwenguii]|uniref:CreA protein n=1 Tax=Neisseria chenwenguii TaxID=1853278 RepID=A0A220RZD9_9NEIS|nr:CreA family protein [Neisseria chenwenguii]ASK26589.1 CreA protein [Neisseria chenwenguii]ROV55398.1 CreA protein [Neisseria chenwenguii]
MEKILTTALCAVLLAACGGNDTDKIGNASTVFHMLGKNDRIEVEGFDDPDVQGVACYISYAKKGGLKETVNLEEDASDASVSCVQTAEVIRYKEAAVIKPRQVFKRGASVAFKSQQIIRYYDAKRKAFAYMVYSDKIIQGSPKNSLSALSCFGGKTADGREIAGLPNRRIFGACVVETAAVPAK